MRNRVGTTTWFLLGTCLSVGLLGCASKERKFGPPNGSDGGTDSRSDASVDPNDGSGTTTETRDTGYQETDTLVIVQRDASAEPTDPTTTDELTTNADSRASTATTDAPASTLDESDAALSSTSAETSSDSDTGAICVPTLEVEGNCTDHVDDDCDGLYDCEDIDDCGTSLDCLTGCIPSGETETACQDGKDDDCDGFPDCYDVDCAHESSCHGECEPVAEECGDSQDNDCDGFVDCQDSDCAESAACCVASGAEICDDGIDNDCDGKIDCPVLHSAIPTLPPPERAQWEGGAVAANHATLVLETPAATQYTVQCRTGKPGDVSSKQFAVCDPLDPSSLEVKPLRNVDAANPAYNGLLTTEVRFAYPNGQTSHPTSYAYYVHNSLAGATPCEDRIEDKAYFDFAATYLAYSNPFSDAEAQLAAPFVNIKFTPSPSMVFEVDEGEGAVEYLSLRRRFALSSDRELLLMKRVYASRRSDNTECLATSVRKHMNDYGGVYKKGRYSRSRCHAVVMNKAGAGLCLVVDDTNTIKIANPTSNAWQYWNFTFHGVVDWAQADNFLWRKLLRTQPDNTFETFSPKCYDGGPSCVDANPHALFLPDRELFDL